jgi:hypothetical protein
MVDSSMILVDHATGSIELLDPLRKLGLPVEKSTLAFGDVVWTGRGEHGASVMIAVELKTVRDLIQSLRSNRLEGHQLPGLQHYDVRTLLIEGEWRVDRRGRVLVRSRGGWKPAHGQMTGAELNKRLHTMRFNAGLPSERTLTRAETVRWIADSYRWWTDKDQDAHTSHLAVYHAPSIVPLSAFRQTITTLPGIGRETSRAVEEFFAGDLELAFSAGREEWEAIEGIGPKTAQHIFDHIHPR